MSLDLHIAPFLAAVFVWWFATGAILWLDHRAARTAQASLWVASLIAMAALPLLWWSTRETSLLGAYAGFAAAIALWAWHELAFLMGWVTGSSRAECPKGVSERDRFRAAWAAVSHHELALAATFVLIAGISWGGENLTGLGVFGTLLVMRTTAKLALYFGAPHAPVEFLPDHMRYLATFFGPKPRSGFLIAVIVVASAAAAALAVFALAGRAPAHHAAGARLVFAMLSLAILEHIFLATPLPDAALWRWAMPRSRRPEGGPANSSGY